MFSKWLFKKCSPLHKKRGFTLIELLITITIVALITGVAVTALNSFNQNQQIDQAAKELETIINEAQTRALSSVGGFNWGVRILINQNTVEVFSNDGLNYTTPTQSIVSHLGSNIIVSNLSPQSGNRAIVMFNVGDGAVKFVRDNGNCLGGSSDSGCGAPRCLAVQLRLSGTYKYSYVKVNERSIFEDPDATGLTPCP